MPNLKIRTLITQECHAGCPFCYCYYKDDCVMEKPVVDRIVEVSLNLKKKYGFRGIKYVISGGDVFQKKNLPKLQYMIDIFRTVTKNVRSPSINPHHDDEIINFVIRNKLPVLVSINVDEKEDRILEVAKRLQKHQVLFDCNLIVEDVNLSRFLSMTENYLKAGLPVRAYPTYDPKDNVIKKLDMEGYFDLLEKYNYNYINSCWGHIQPWRPKPIGGVCGFGDSFFCVTPTGDILSCYPLQLSRKGQPIAERAGTIWDDDPIESVRQHAKKFGYDEEYPESCNNCEYVIYCRGGCHANRFYFYETFSGKNKTPYCDLHKYAISRIKKIYSKLDWGPVERLGWKVTQEERGKNPINLSTFYHWIG